MGVKKYVCRFPFDTTTCGVHQIYKEL